MRVTIDWLINRLLPIGVEGGRFISWPINCNTLAVQMIPLRGIFGLPIIVYNNVRTYVRPWPFGSDSVLQSRTVLAKGLRP